MSCFVVHACFSLLCRDRSYLIFINHTLKNSIMDAYIEAFHIFPITIPATVSAHHTLLLVAAVINCLVFANIKIFSKHQRLIPGIPIVGGDSQQDIKNSRIRFIHDGKAMLEEGYKKVSCSLHFYFYADSVAYIVLVWRGFLLCPECTRGASNDTRQIPGRSEDCSHRSSTFRCYLF